MNRLSLLISGIFLAAVSLQSAESAGNCRIVDYGADMGLGSLTYRGVPAVRGIKGTVDRDGDGSLDDEFISSWPFSLEEPLNASGLRYDTDQKNAVFYGGLVLYSSNPAKPDKPRAISEGHMNANHEFRDDFNFMGGLEDHGTNELVEAYGVWFWQKKDFLNSGDKRPVSFDADSLIAVHISRYWCGMHAGRWMVRDGDQFYLSKKTFGDSYRAFGLEVKTPSENPVVHATNILKPEETEWAEYNPQVPYQIDFDAKTAEFKPHQFKDVTAVGFFVNRDSLKAAKVAGGLRPPFAVKWNSFRCDAVVAREPQDALIATVPVSGPDGKPLLYAGKGEVSFSQWEKIWRISVGNQYCPGLGDLGYTFDRDGAMGSMRADDKAHKPNEPVTDILLTDAIAFCNALSEFEGLTPAYYADPDFEKPLRRTVDRDMRENWHKHAKVYWNKDANGYRLPTQDEWLYLAGNGKGEAFDDKAGWNKSTAGGRTHEVSTSAPNGLGICDLAGNVWEYVWPGISSDLDLDDSGSVTVLGGSFCSPDLPESGNLTPFVSNPWKSGSYDLGFRVVRNARTSPASVSAKNSAPQWIVRKDAQIPSLHPMSKDQLASKVQEAIALEAVNAGMIAACDEMDPDVVKEMNKQVAMAQNNRFLKKITPEEADVIIKANTIDRKRTVFPMAIGKAEIPYSIWKLVKGWAENNGYSFNYSGDMGSMRHATDKNFSYEQDEPVTQICWYDTLVWCNALSEIFGQTPVYYANIERTVPYKTALWFRLDMFADQGGPNMPWATVMEKGSRLHTGSGDRIYMKIAATGFRLPLDVEFFKANKPGEEKNEWTGANADDKTHPVGMLPAYVNGLCDMNGNVFEWGWDSEKVNFEFINASYNINGGGYFYETLDKTAPRPANPASFSEFTATAWPFVGFRVSAAQAQ